MRPSLTADCRDRYSWQAVLESRRMERIMMTHSVSEEGLLDVTRPPVIPPAGRLSVSLSPPPNYQSSHRDIWDQFWEKKQLHPDGPEHVQSRAEEEKNSSQSD